MHSRIRFSLLASTLAASAAAHALVLVTFRSVRVGSGSPAQQYAEMIVVLEDPQAEPPREKSEFEIGQFDATGYATHEVDGRREQMAREAPQDQPSLGLDPVGMSQRVEVPSAPVEAAPVPLAVASAPPPPPPPPLTSAMAVPPPALPPDVEHDLRRERIEALVPAAPADLPPPTQGADLAVPPETTEPPPPQPPPSQPKPAAPAVVAPPPPAVAGTGADVAPQGDSESDAFSVLGSVEFRAGRVSVQSGRQVKTRRPKIGLAGMVELTQRNAARVELDVSVDRTGTVTNVEVARSSGSNNIDQPCRVAMYDWWFEPKKDDAGRPVPDRFRFTISFH